MAEAIIALTCLGNIAEGFLGKVGEYLFAPIQRQLKYMCCFNSNITELETQLNKLETTKEGVQLRVKEDLDNVRIIAPEVKNWLERADEVTPEVNGIIQDKAKVKEGCLYGWCPNLKLRYSLSRKAVKKSKVVFNLQADKDSYNKPASSPEPACKVTIPNGDFMGFESRKLVMEKIIEALKNDEINLIGVCGMGGVGKTTLVKEVANRAKEDKHFGEVAMAIVGQKPDLTNVQVCIADTLGLKNLRNTESPIERANLLRQRLLQDNKKVLVILDDIWADKFDLQGERIDLQDMGIPLGGANKNFKMLYTSRTQALWHEHQRIKKEIPLDPLSEDEAWQLFREKAGDSADAPDLHPIAKQIVDKCGCLPLALVLIGSTLSKKSGRNAIKEIWEDMRDRLTRATKTPVGERLYSCLKPSYDYLEEEEAKRLFLLCCLFEEDEDIRLEDLVRYGFGLSLFDGINEMRKARNRVSALVDDLKSSYLLLDDKDDEFVKVHDVVRDMGIFIASKDKSAKDKSALVIHEEVSELPKDTYEHYSSISLISRKITELPKGLACPNLEFLLLDCRELKELPCQFFEGMGKLKVLVLKNFKGILPLPSSLRNLHTLSLPFFHGKLDNVSEFGGLFNLKTLSFRDSWMEELPEEIGELVDLRLLDLTGSYRLKRIPPNVISRLVHLEELYVFGGFKDWEGEGKEEEGRNANLRELEFLSNLNTLEICIRSNVVIPKVPIFSKLKIYEVTIFQDDDMKMDDDTRTIRDEERDDEMHNIRRKWLIKQNIRRKCKTVFTVRSSIPIPSNRGGIDSLLRSSDFLVLAEKGCNDLVQALLLWDEVDGLQQLKLLEIRRCDTPECLVNTRNSVRLPIAHAPAIFPILELLDLLGLVNLREICCGPVPARSFGELTFIQVENCGRLRNLFQLPIVGCLPQLKRLIISSCGMMEEVFWKDQQEDVHAAANRIEFPKLEVLKLEKLPSLKRFCRGIDQIDFPQLKELCLEDCGRLRNLFQLQIVGCLPQLKRLIIRSCDMMEEVFGKDQQEDVHAATNRIEFPKLEVLKLEKLPSLMGFCRGIDQIDFPQLKELYLRNIPQVNLLFHNSCNLSSNSLFPEKVSLPNLEILRVDKLKNLERLGQRPLSVGSFSKLNKIFLRDCGKLQNASDLWSSELLTRSFSKLKNLQVTSCTSLGNIPCISWFGDLNNTTQGLQEVAGLLYYTEYDGDSVIALGSNGTMTMWTWNWPSRKVTTSVLPSRSHPAMTNDVTGVNLEEAVPCMAFSNNIYREIISACGGAISLFNGRGWEVLRTFMPPPPASTFLAFYPQEYKLYNIIAIGMEDSTIRIYNYRKDEVKSELKGHKKRITGLAFSTYLNILVSSAADAQLCIWRIDTWEHLKSVSIPLPADKVCNGDTRVQFHSDRIRLLVSHETQLAIYDASEMDRIRQWVPQDILPAPISFAVYSCNSQLVYTSFRDGNIGVFDADSLALACRILPSIYLYPAMLSGGQAVYPRVVTAHPEKPNQFAIGLTNGFVIIMEPQESESKWGLSPSTVDNGMLNDRTTYSSNTINHTPDQNIDGPMAGSMEKPKTLDDVTNKSKSWKVAENQCQLVFMPDSTEEAHKVAHLLYKNGCEVLALGCNGALRLWRRYSSINNQSGKATASVVPQQWQPASGLAMTNDVTGVNLEEAVPCMALSKNYSNIISACGGAISLFDARTLEVMKMFMSPPPSSTFLAFHPQDDNIIAIGMEDSTIRIYNNSWYKVKSELKGHEKRITCLAFSTNLNILVSSGADAQLCIWSIKTWEHLKSVPIQLPAGKACNGNTTVQFHSDQIRLLVSHETQLVIYDAVKMDHIHQWVPQDVLPAPISFAAYSCDSQLVYTSFCDGNIGVFDADSLTPTHRIAPSAYSPTLSSGSHVVYPLAIATHPWKPNQFVIGLTNGSVIIMEPQESEGKWGLSSNTSNHAPDQNQRKEEEELDEDEDEEDEEEKRKKKEKGKAPQSG